VSTGITNVKRGSKKQRYVELPPFKS